MSEIIECPHRNKDSECEVGSILAGRSVVPWDNVCKACSECTVPQAINYVTASIAAYAWQRDANDKETADRLRAKFRQDGLFRIGRPQVELDLGDGPGTILHDRLSGMGFEVTPTCPCLYWIRQMNSHDTAWSRVQSKNIASAMVTEFKRRYPQKVIGTLDLALLAASRRLIFRACREWDKINSTATT